MSFPLVLPSYAPVHRYSAEACGRKSSEPNRSLPILTFSLEIYNIYMFVRVNYVPVSVFP